MTKNNGQKPPYRAKVSQFDKRELQTFLSVEVECRMLVTLYRMSAIDKKKTSYYLTHQAHPLHFTPMVTCQKFELLLCMSHLECFFLSDELFLSLFKHHDKLCVTIITSPFHGFFMWINKYKNIQFPSLQVL